MPRNSITRQRKLSVDAKGWAGCAGNFQKLILFIYIFDKTCDHFKFSISLGFQRVG